MAQVCTLSPYREGAGVHEISGGFVAQILVSRSGICLLLQSWNGQKS